MIKFEDHGSKFEVVFKYPKNDPKLTICMIRIDNELEAVGCASCSEKDNFCRNIGRKVSLAKALKHFEGEQWKSFRAFIWNKYFEIRGKKE